MFAGARSLSATYNAAWAGLRFTTASFSTIPYNSLQFYINAGGRSLASFSVSLYDSSGSELTSVNPHPYGASAGGGWTKVTIPPSALGGAIRTITGVRMWDNTGEPQPVFWIDDLGFVSGVPGTPVPTATPPPPSP
ncbi:MAG: hypothetical protein FJ319_07985 [SAR202 cluster bacterium]|nr:hypothetical protein [SAR202 cluster bacterium]